MLFTALFRFQSQSVTRSTILSGPMSPCYVIHHLGRMCWTGHYQQGTNLYFYFRNTTHKKKWNFDFLFPRREVLYDVFFYVLVLFYKEITLGWTLFCLMLILNSVRVEFDGMVYLQDNSNFLLKEF